MNAHAESMNAVLTALFAKEGQLSEAEAAQIAQLSPRRFRTIFRTTFGETFRVLRLRVRMEAARKRLVETDRSISDITEGLGYSRRAKLERPFKEHFGVTPAQYRKNQKFLEIAAQGVDTQQRVD